MSKEQFESEKRHVEGNKSISNFIFVCPQCGKELMPSSICKDCFPNGSYIETTAEQESFIDSEMYKIDSDIETQSVQALDKEEKNTAEDSESDHFTWQDFLYLVNVLRLFYKKYTKKVWLVSSVVVLAITAFATYQHFTPKGKLILFAEKKNLVYSYTKKPSEKYVIEKNWNSELKGGFSMYNYYSFARASQDEKYIFYRKQKVVSTVADNVTRETDEEFGTYYRYDVEGKKKIKIDDQVRNSFTASSTNISPSGSKAMYLKGTDNKLVIWNNGKKITIDEMVSFYFVNKQATHVFYGKQGGNYENQGKIYEWSEKTGKKTVSENAVLQGFQMDQNGEISIYFKKDQSIYFKNGDNATKLVSTKADSILSCSGEKIYYTVSSALPFRYRDFVEDSLEESDKEIVQPTTPLSGGEYTQKLQRDMIRQSFDHNIPSIVSDLYYFDGEKSTLLDKNIGVSSFYQASMKNPLLIYRKMDEKIIQNLKNAGTEKQKIDISKVYDLYQLDAYISQLMNQNSKTILAQGIKKGLIEQSSGTQFMVSPNGKWIGFIDDSSHANRDLISSYSGSYYAETGKLKKFKIEDLKEFKPSLVDDNVNSNFFFKGNELFYTKGTFEGIQTVDLYVNGKKLLKNVDESTYATFEMYRYFGFAKQSDVTKFYGMSDKSNYLYEINGNSKRELAKNVETFVPLKDKSIVYIKDFKMSDGYGKLMIDDGKNKPILISNRASMIVQNNDFLMY